MGWYGIEMTIENEDWINEWRKRAMIQMGKIINYHWQETSEDKKYRLSVVSGRTDVPAFKDVGYFEVAIIGTDHNNIVEELTVQVINSCCEFSEVARIQKQFRSNASKLYKKIAKSTARAYA